MRGLPEGRPMPEPAFKVEFRDRWGTKYKLTVEGRLTSEKIRRLLEVAGLLSVISEEEGEELEIGPPPAEMTLYERLQLVIERYFPDEWFTARDVRDAYEREFGEPVKASTVSTYLARMVERRFLARSGPPSRRRYRLIVESMRPMARF